eukprot:scaffold35485_cov76-Phaeocystis_antarctica.AAC.4
MPRRLPRHRGGGWPRAQRAIVGVRRSTGCTDGARRSSGRGSSVSIDGARRSSGSIDGVRRSTGCIDGAAASAARNLRATVDDKPGSQVTPWRRARVPACNVHVHCVSIVASRFGCPLSTCAYNGKHVLSRARGPSPPSRRSRCAAGGSAGKPAPLESNPLSLGDWT